MNRRHFHSFVLVLGFAAAVGCGTREEQRNGSSPSTRTQWIETRNVRPGPILHDTLDAGQMERIRILHQTFSEVDSSSFDKWVEDFRRDQDPEREIRTYENIAATYRAYCSGRKLTPEMKLDVYGVVLLRSGAPDSEVLAHIELKVLSVEDAKEVLKLYKAAPRPFALLESSGR